MGDQRRLFSLYFLLYIASIVGVATVSSVDFDQLTIATAATTASAAIGPAFIAVTAVSNYLWRFRLIRLALGINLPYIGGRWQGHIRSSRTNHDERHVVFVEFWQTLTSLVVWYYDENAVTSSLVAGFLRDNMGGPLRLYCVYRNQPIRTDQPGLQTHNGVMELVVAPSGGRIVGIYYNNPHQRNTYGEIDLRFVGRKRLGAFSPEQAEEDHAPPASS